MIIETKHILKNMQNSHEIDGNIAKINKYEFIKNKRMRIKDNLMRSRRRKKW